LREIVARRAVVDENSEACAKPLKDFVPHFVSHLVEDGQEDKVSDKGPAVARFGHAQPRGSLSALAASTKSLSVSPLFEWVQTVSFTLPQVR